MEWGPSWRLPTMSLISFLILLVCIYFLYLLAIEDKGSSILLIFSKSQIFVSWFFLFCLFSSFHCIEFSPEFDYFLSPSLLCVISSFCYKASRCAEKKPAWNLFIFYIYTYHYLIWWVCFQSWALRSTFRYNITIHLFTCFSIYEMFL